MYSPISLHGLGDGCIDISAGGGMFLEFPPIAGVSGLWSGGDCSGGRTDRDGSEMERRVFGTSLGKDAHQFARRSSCGTCIGHGLGVANSMITRISCLRGTFLFPEVGSSWPSIARCGPIGSEFKSLAGGQTRKSLMFSLFPCFLDSRWSEV